MLRSLLSRDPWFDPKPLGFGAGLPCAWQGWALLFGYIVLMTGLAMRVEAGGLALGATGMIFATIAFIWLAMRHTRGGWRWRQ